MTDQNFPNNEQREDSFEKGGSHLEKEIAMTDATLPNTFDQTEGFEIRIRIAHAAGLKAAETGRANAPEKDKVIRSIVDGPHVLSSDEICMIYDAFILGYSLHSEPSDMPEDLAHE